ncbi:hypothetical protein Poli38472_003270 [Pythium oligandrum]|uniref:DUF4485 domain-containing protein n=1 Tax=Pythium oligandrum TaxID=41045 RepID=A0A8K1FBJ3_PYTOL|nr:hypothetical protein Poli38472_003270 [Pythium oligandrum]|eukprot:TMW57345.1 hypothetical protein Poli38472_003270 [Pythium oligandrum]
MPMNRVRVAHAHENERVRELLARVQELNVHSTKHQQIRVNHWVRKLLDQPVSNPAWLKNVMEHAATLLQMMLTGVVEEPFVKMPPQGPLPSLPRHKVARLVTRSGSSSALIRESDRRLASISKARPVFHPTSRPAPRQMAKDIDDEISPPRPKRMESKQIQTTVDDDHWEWQRVWKGAFERMQRELKERNAHVQTLNEEVKELRKVIMAQERSLDQEARLRDDLKIKHRAEVENLKSLHELEIEELKAKHKKQIQAATLQNEDVLRRCRREKEMGGPFNMQSDNYGEFLAYIDDFYADTLHLTKTQSA